MTRTWHHFTTESSDPKRAGTLYHTTLPGDLSGPGACDCPGNQYAKRGNECRHIRGYRAALRLLYRGQHTVTEHMIHPALHKAQHAEIPKVGTIEDCYRS